MRFDLNNVNGYGAGTGAAAVSGLDEGTPLACTIAQCHSWSCPGATPKFSWKTVVLDGAAEPLRW